MNPDGMNRITAVCVGLLFIGVGALTAQSFDVVSIKPVTPESSVPIYAAGINVNGPNQLRGRNVTPLELIRAAWPEYIHNDQIVGATGWVTTERFDLDARSSGTLSPGVLGLSPAVARMLRQILEDRFRLRSHEDKRELSVYLLTPTRADRQLNGIRTSAQRCMTEEATKNPKCYFNRTVRSMSMGGMPIEFLISVLAGRAGRPVINDTGLEGAIDLQLKWEVDLADPVGSDASLFAALGEQLGLKLESKKLTMPVLVVDSIQRPTAN